MSRLTIHVRDCPIGFADGKIVAGRSTTDADVIAWIEQLKELARAEDTLESDLMSDVESTKGWLAIKQIVSGWISQFENSDTQRQLLEFMASHWPTHAPREIEFAVLRRQLQRVAGKRDKFFALLKIPTSLRRRAKHSHAVIICREQEVDVKMFDDLATAATYEDEAGANWSESYLCEVLKGPLV